MTDENEPSAITEIMTAVGLPDIAGVPIPPAVKRNFWKSVSQLITGVFDVPAAMLEGKAQRIRTDASATNMVTISAAKAAAEQFNNNTALGDRAVNYFASRIVQEQINREEVAKVAAESLAADPPKSDCSQEIDQDWLTEFSVAASKKTSEEMRILLGRILAGEVSQPGSFSPATIQSITTLTKHTAQKFRVLCELSTTWPGNFTCVITSPFPKFAEQGLVELGLNYGDFLNLQSAGLLMPTLTSTLGLEPYLNNMLVNYAGKNILFGCTTQDQTAPLKGQKLSISVFSPIGHELRRIIPMARNPVYDQSLRAWLKQFDVSIVDVLNA